MTALELAGLLIFVLFLLLGSGVWVALSLLGVAIITMIGFTSAPAAAVMGTTIWSSSATWALAPLPLFIWMGEILFRSRLSEDMFTGLAPWLSRLPGRLLHVNILGCGIFAAVSGSSAATAATIGRMSVPELRRRRYPEGMIIGTLAGSGTLGLMIPPSIIMIVYGVAADVSLARLFVAGVLPGALLIVLFMGYVAAWSVFNADALPVEPSVPLAERLYRSRRLVPVILLIAGVIGSIYTGFATPTEAAALGVVGALLLSGLGGSLDWATFREALMGATRTSCMIAFILAGAAFLTTAMGFTGIPRSLAAAIGALHLPPALLLAVLTVFFLVLGSFLDGISMVVLTTSVILPVVEAARIDLLWFGIYIVMVVEMAQVTPPVGFNLFVLQALTGRDLFRVAWAALPFCLLLIVAIVLISLFPAIVTFLPSHMVGP